MTKTETTETEKYNYVVIHSTPDLWPAVSNYERRINPKVVVVGITVWETQDIPKEWIKYLKFVDKISTPS